MAHHVKATASLAHSSIIVCNRNTEQWVREASQNEIKVSCDACRASFHMIRPMAAIDPA